MLAGAVIFAVVPESWAALPPNYQRIAELQAILSDSAVVETFKVKQPIDRIEFVKTDLYRVTAGACHVDVAIVDKPGEKRPGPRQFTVKVITRTCPD
ncbi:hypothetical protein [Taklimakanibacter deserti]|uniref:hypothetical protein n=1 Tax=Taklimakanibacter deserti TaxID=2267839 RepID=UPI0013C4058F